MSVHMVYTLSWFCTLQKPSEPAMYHHFEAVSLKEALMLSLEWWCDQVRVYRQSPMPYTVDEVISHQFGVYAYLSNSQGLIIADLRSLTPGNSTSGSFVWEVRKGVAE